MKKKNKDKKNNNTRIGLIITLIVLIVVVPIILFYSTKYITNKDIMGQYELVEGFGEKNLAINLVTWSEGDKEDLKCDLWTCDGYEYGKYSIKGNKIDFHFHSTGHIIYEYEIKEEYNETYLLLKDRYIDKVRITKYKKIK